LNVDEWVRQLTPDFLHENIREGWRETQQDFPASTAELDFLQEAWLDRWHPLLQLCDEAADAFRRTCRLIREQPALARLSWHLHSRLFRQDGDSRELIRHWPDLKATMGRDAGMLAVVVVVSGMAHAEAIYLSRNIPRETMIDTFGDLGLWMRNYREAHGEWGLEQTSWLLHHVKGELFRLGRLQFMLRPFRAKARVFHHAAEGRTIALCEAGMEVRGDGMINGTNGVYDSEQSWTTGFYEDDERVSGYPIDPRGFIRRQRISLSLQDWRLVLGRGEPVLDIHIPEDGKMDFVQCGESIATAQSFFAAHYPENTARACTCTSWLMDPQLGEMLPEQANIVRFQRQFYLIPVLSNDKATLSRVFGEYPIVVDSAPRDTTLRRSILDWMRAGGRMCSASGFILMSDLDWGKQDGRFV
jgi:hypothetical protein